MTRRQRRLDRIRQNPKNVRFEDLRRVLEDYGFELHRVRGSHHYFVGTVAGEEYQLAIPFEKPHVKPVYVRRALDVIGEIEKVDNDD